ncbi:ParB/RepB/Spo0J family partition protein [Clostridium estertheticum]|uniref:ParB/RepB/Spo0J family partition protein n=1 Tax=Clostridium estertheticum TaxID=238834 RepID=UPI001C6DF00A|nr:ParB/RepB/Spo0J family partition protein [Clostridium estertheticum]MBW9169749.1 ParB/RepB/Spo0J family partition protein [Clostridium estertheticum]WLC74745.1 ParB/RepB/Spo0J family partition protein [Clostridium estertheticum]
MEQITNVSINILKVHPRNQEFYDDIEGEAYDKFEKSIDEDGVITPLIVAPDMTIISGHQRYKAGLKLGIKLIPVIIKEDLIDEDDKLRKLFATNFGRIKNNPMKQGRVYSEYEKLCGVRQGSAGNTDPHFVGRITQEQIAKELGISTETIRRLKQLQNLSPDLQQLIEDGSVKYTTALNVFSKLSIEEQKQMIDEIGKEEIKDMTAKQIALHIKEKQDLELANKTLEDSFNNLSRKYSMEQNKPKDVETVEIDNTDYTLADKNKQLISEKNKLQTRLDLMTNKADAYSQDSSDYKKMKDEMTCLIEKKDDLSRKILAITDISGLVVEINHLINGKLAPVRYSKSLKEAKDDEIVLRNLTEMVETIEQWCTEMRKYVPNKIDYVEVI